MKGSKRGSALSFQFKLMDYQDSLVFLVIAEDNCEKIDLLVPERLTNLSISRSVLDLYYVRASMNNFTIKNVFR